MTKSLFVVTLLSLPVRRIATAVNCKLKKKTQIFLSFFEEEDGAAASLVSDRGDVEGGDEDDEDDVEGGDENDEDEEDEASLFSEQISGSLLCC